MTEVSAPDEEQQGWIRVVASALSRAFPLVEREDIEQQLYLLWYEKWDVVQKMVNHPQRSKELTQTCLRRWGYDYAKSETAMARGWRVEDMQQYAPKMVGELLPFLLDPESWSSIASKGGEGPASPKLKNQAGDALAIYADLTKGWDALRTIDRDVLLRRFIYGVSLEALAVQWDVNEDTARKRCERALARLAEKMSGLHYERAGRLPQQGRRAMSNTHAMAVTGESWSG